MLVKITTKHGSNGLVRFVTHKRFAVLFFLPSRLLRKLTIVDKNLLYSRHINFQCYSYMYQ